MKEINKILQHSTELAKVLANTLSAQSLDSAGKVKMNKQISTLHSHAAAVEEMLQQICNEYAVEVNNAKLMIWERKRFIKFAQQEKTAINSNSGDKERNENLIHQIAACLKKKGYEVNTSVGTSDFRIDIAVIDPLDHEKYILGIICDGEGYYRLKTARDREIVQPSVLKKLGWELMHVWALDWFMHPEMVTKNILERLENIK